MEHCRNRKDLENVVTAGGFFEVTGSEDEFVKIQEGILEYSDRATSSDSFTLDVWLEMRDEWFAAQRVVSGWLVTIKLPRNKDHNPSKKVTAPCVVSDSCTDQTGEHHTVLVHSEEEIDALREKFGHITRIEKV